MEEGKGKKKYRYTYYTATGKEEIDVDENWYEILRQADKEIYNNNRREEYKSYHLNSYVDDESGEEHDAWETVADKETLQMESDICAKMDEDWVLDCLSKRNKYIYEKCVVEGVSQSAVANELGLTQSSVSRRLKKILYAMEWQRLKDGRSKREIKEELDFRQMERANDTELGESVLVDYFLGSILEEQDLINFIGWFYSAKELKRYTFKAWRKLGMVDDYPTLTNPMRKIVLNHYEVKKGRAFTKAEEKYILDFCKENPHYYGNDAILLLMYTGMRVGELKTVEYDGRYITCISEKTRKGRKEIVRKIPVSPMLKKILPMIDFEKVKKISKDCARDTIKRMFPDRHTHELRYTFITRAKECGVNPEVVMLWVGHEHDQDVRTSKVDRGYTTYSEEYLLSEILKIDYEYEQKC